MTVGLGVLAPLKLLGATGRSHPAAVITVAGALLLADTVDAAIAEADAYAAVCPQAVAVAKYSAARHRFRLNLFLLHLGRLGSPLSSTVPTGPVTQQGTVAPKLA